MKEYRIRITKFDGALSMESHEIHLNVNGAIRSAKKMALGLPFEVWCDDICVYSIAGGNGLPLAGAAASVERAKRPLQTGVARRLHMRS